MNEFCKNAQLYKNCDPVGTLSLEAAAALLGWSRSMCYSYKYYISELPKEQLEILDQADIPIELNIIVAICIQNPMYISRLFNNIQRIVNANSPFLEIEALVREMKGKDPLSAISPRYWIEVGQYLTSRRLDQYPFTKKAIGFIKGVGYKSYDTLTANQIKWITDLIKEDKKRPSDDRFFVNEHLLEKGFKADCTIIDKFQIK